MSDHHFGVTVQVRELLAKYWLVYWRTPSYNFTRTLLTLVVSLVYGSMYYKQGNIPEPATIANVQNVMGILFSSTNFLGMTNMMAVMPVVGESACYCQLGAHYALCHDHVFAGMHSFVCFRLAWHFVSHHQKQCSSVPCGR